MFKYVILKVERAGHVKRVGKKRIPTAIRKTHLVVETKMSKKNKKALELIQAYKGMFG